MSKGPSLGFSVPGAGQRQGVYGFSDPSRRVEDEFTVSRIDARQGSIRSPQHHSKQQPHQQHPWPAFLVVVTIIILLLTEFRRRRRQHCGSMEFGFLGWFELEWLATDDRIHDHGRDRRVKKEEAKNRGFFCCRQLIHAAFVFPSRLLSSLLRLDFTWHIRLGRAGRQPRAAPSRMREVGPRHEAARASSLAPGPKWTNSWHAPSWSPQFFKGGRSVHVALDETASGAGGTVTGCVLFQGQCIKSERITS